jgi:hypothetical protein
MSELRSSTSKYCNTDIACLSHCHQLCDSFSVDPGAAKFENAMDAFEKADAFPLFNGRLRGLDRYYYSLDLLDEMRHTAYDETLPVPVP